MPVCSFWALLGARAWAPEGKKGAVTIVVDPDGYSAFPRLRGGETLPSPFWGERPNGLNLAR